MKSQNLLRKEDHIKRDVLSVTKKVQKMFIKLKNLHWRDQNDKFWMSIQYLFKVPQRWTSTNQMKSRMTYNLFKSFHNLLAFKQMAQSHFCLIPYHLLKTQKMSRVKTMNPSKRIYPKKKKTMPILVQANTLINNSAFNSRKLISSRKI